MCPCLVNCCFASTTTCTDDFCCVLAAALLLDRRDPDWLGNIPDRRHYCYPVHGSRKLLEMPTLSASLYLLLFRFLQRRYEEVCASAISCTSDTQLSEEEAQVCLAPDTSPWLPTTLAHISTES